MKTWYRSCWCSRYFRDYKMLRRVHLPHYTISHLMDNTDRFAMTSQRNHLTEHRCPDPGSRHQVSHSLPPGDDTERTRHRSAEPDRSIERRRSAFVPLLSAPSTDRIGRRAKRLLRVRDKMRRFTGRSIPRLDGVENGRQRR